MLYCRSIAIPCLMSFLMSVPLSGHSHPPILAFDFNFDKFTNSSWFHSLPPLPRVFVQRTREYFHPALLICSGQISFFFLKLQNIGSHSTSLSNLLIDNAEHPGIYLHMNNSYCILNCSSINQSINQSINNL